MTLSFRRMVALAMRPDRRVFPIAGLVLLAGMAADGRPVMAAEPPPPLPEPTLQQRFQTRSEPLPFHIDGFEVRPQLRLGEAIDDNIYATTGARRSDLITQATAGAAVRRDIGPHSFGADGSITYNKYADHATEDNWLGSVGAGGSYQIHHDLSLVGAARASRMILPRDDPNGINGLEPTPYRQYDASGGAVVGSPGLQLRAMAGVQRQLFDAVQSLGGMTSPGDRNRDEVFIDTRLSRAYLPSQFLYADLRVNDRTYFQTVNSSGFRRDSQGVAAAVGATGLVGAYQFRMGVGFASQAYADHRFGRVTTPTIDLTGIWYPTQLTSLTLEGLHDYVEDVGSDSPGYIRSDVALGVDHELRRDWLLGARVAFRHRDLVNASRTVDLVTLEGRVQHLFGGNLVGEIAYYRADQTTSGGGTPYDRDIFMLRLRQLF